MTVIALFVVAAVVPVVLVVHAAGWRRAMLEERRRTVRALHRLAAVIDQAHRDPGSAPDAVTVGLEEVLHLRSCRFVEGPAPAPVPELRPDGDVDARVLRRARSGLVLPARALLRVRGGAFVLDGDPDRGTSVEERLVAVAMARVAVASYAPSSSARTTLASDFGATSV